MNEIDPIPGRPPSSRAHMVHQTALLDILIVSMATGLSVAVPATILVGVMQATGHLEVPDNGPHLVVRGLGFALWLAVAGLFYQSLVAVIELIAPAAAHYVAAPVWVLLAVGGLFAAYLRPDELEPLGGGDDDDSNSTDHDPEVTT